MSPAIKLSREQLADISVLLQMRVNKLRDVNRPAFAEEQARAEDAMAKITQWLESTGYPEIIEPSEIETAIADTEPGERE